MRDLKLVRYCLFALSFLVTQGNCATPEELAFLMVNPAVIYKNVIELSEGSFFNQNEEIVYTKKMHRFRDTHKYDPINGSALDEIDFNVSRADASNNKAIPLPPRFDQAIPIIALDPNTSRETIYAYIFVSKKLNMVVLSFTATETLGELLSDIEFLQVPPFQLNHYQEGILVERGFYRIYLEIYEAIRKVIPTYLNKCTQFVISGHSLGGALTTLAAFDLAKYQPIVYTFASPRVGNVLFAQTYNQLSPLRKTWRVFNTEDLVPVIPLPEFPFGIVLKDVPSIIYEHVGNPVSFTVNLETLLSNHIAAYQSVIIDGNAPDNPNGIVTKKVSCKH